MGLDILVHPGPLEKHANSHGDVSDNEYDTLYERGVLTVLSAPWGYARPLEDGAVYVQPETGKGSIHFRAGSYSGYNRWREELSEFAFNVSPDAVWKHPEKYAGKPFFEIVNFSDCEGTIGPEVAAKLAKDFEEFREAARKAWPTEGPDSYWGDYRFELYERFAEGFRLAADTEGAVQWG